LKIRYFFQGLSSIRKTGRRLLRMWEQG